MLLIRCAACRAKLWKYQKIGPGALLICHKDRISRVYPGVVLAKEARCSCGAVVGHDQGSWIKMVGRAFTASGTKDRP